MKANYILFLLFLSFLKVNAQDPFSREAMSVRQFLSKEIKITDLVSGGLTLPKTDTKTFPLLIFIPDQGPIDRNGNDPRAKHYAYKQLSDSLVKNEVATFRYDKRTYTQVKQRIASDSTLFNDFVEDAGLVLKMFENDKRFSHLYLIGHGQGSLVSLLIANQNVTGIISIAGAGETLDKLIVGQIAEQQPGLDKVARATFDKVLAQTDPVLTVERDLYTIISPEMQPFMKSWMVHDPGVLLQNYNGSVLLINGKRNRQVNISQTEKLLVAKPESEHLLIDDMNHIFKRVGRDDIEASKSYINSEFPIHEKLIEAVISFVSQ
ncbi:MAG: alpha/beta hydrolase [Nonlabens sp.]